jgi:hypothetical protein
MSLSVFLNTEIVCTDLDKIVGSSWHHMALQPKSGPGLPFWDFVTITFLQGWIVSQRPTPNLEDQVSVFMTPGDRVAQLYPQVLGTYFSCL